MSMAYQHDPEPSPDNEASEELFVNPFCESEYGTPPEPCILVIFGASGDLTGKKLIPAVFNLMKEGNLPTNFICVGVARRPKTAEAFRNEMLEHIKKFSRTTPEEPELRTFVEK